MSNYKETKSTSFEGESFIRAGGDCLCEICGRKYINHPMDEEVLSWIEDWDGKRRPFLHILCDGTRVKL